jgi:putative effector of murein hydrolase LrgA (UPF0299 family)
VTATTVMTLAILLYIIARWAHNKPAVTLPGVVSGLFAVFIIAILDHGRTEQIAKGFAWLFFIVAAYNAIPPLAAAAVPAAKKSAGQAKATLI